MHCCKNNQLPVHRSSFMLFLLCGYYLGEELKWVPCIWSAGNIAFLKPSFLVMNHMPKRFKEQNWAVFDLFLLADKIRSNYAKHVKLRDIWSNIEIDATFGSSNKHFNNVKWLMNMLDVPHLVSQPSFLILYWCISYYFKQ